MWMLCDESDGWALWNLMDLVRSRGMRKEEWIYDREGTAVAFC